MTSSWASSRSFLIWLFLLLFLFLLHPHLLVIIWMKWWPNKWFSFASLSYITLTPSLLKFSCLHVTVLLPVEQPAALSHIVVCANEIYGDKKQDQIEADEAWCLQSCGRMLTKCKIAAELHANMKTTWSQQSASVWQQSGLRWSQLCCA